MEIKQITKASQKSLDDINKLLPQLSAGKTLGLQAFKQIIKDKNHYFFGAFQDEKIVGIGSLIILNTTTGKKARVEDVVVDKSQRGKGAGRALMEELIDLAKRLKVKGLHLTSSPSRQAANALYQKLGFSQKETNVYILRF